MTIEEAIEKLTHYWFVGIDDDFTSNEINELIEMLQELAEYREQDGKRMEEKALDLERDYWEREK